MPYGIQPTTDLHFGTNIAGQQRAFVLLDSILVLLLAVGLWNPRAIALQKRLGGLQEGDFQLLRTFVSSFSKVVTTPHILTEASNLAGAASGQSRLAIFAQLASLVDTLEERHLPATSLIKQPEFLAFGLTDAALSTLAPDMLLLTNDGRLANHLQRRGLSAMSLTDVRHLRSIANRG